MKWDPATSQWKLQTYRPLPKLYPERTNSWEAGLNAKFFNNSLSLELPGIRLILANKHSKFLYQEPLYMRLCMRSLVILRIKVWNFL